MARPVGVSVSIASVSRYPYAGGEHFPEDPLRRQYERDYNTRLALRLIRPLSWSANLN
jgi:hypothetical protein